jgi:hypothetical protein
MGNTTGKQNGKMKNEKTWLIFHFVFSIMFWDSQIKGPDNPTSQLLAKISKKCGSRDGESRKDKGGGGGCV